MKLHSLKGDKAFHRLRHGKRASSAFMGIRWREASETRQPASLCVGIITNKKVSKRAVVRNRVRRRIREALRDILSTNNTKNVAPIESYDILIISYPDSAEANYWQLRAALKQALERSHFPLL